MFESVYETLARIGYTHPLHPTITHVVMGLVIGAFVFGLVSALFKRESLAQTGRHCMVLAIIALPPTAFVGFMDWQHRFAGAYIFPIVMKLILAGVLLVLLAIAIGLGLKTGTWSRDTLITYALCLVVVMGIGYFGGELVYGERAPAAEPQEGLVSEGGIVFNENCSACHHSDKAEYKIGPGLKGLFKMEKLPVSGRPVDEANVRMQIKTPFRNMPAFPELTEQKMEALIAYLKTL